MKESEFNQLVDTTLLAIEETIEEADTEIDYDTIGGILTLEFEDGSRIIINRQTSQFQLWLATKGGGFHFNWLNNHWVDEKNNVDFFICLTEHVSQQAGYPIKFNIDLEK